ncbi:w0003 [Escherichia coli]|nr:w0003 [Escherichia coli]
MKLIIFILIVLIIAALLIRIILRSVNQHSPLLMQLHAAGIRTGDAERILSGGEYWQRQKTLLTEREVSFMKGLFRIVDMKRWYLCPQVRVADIVQLNGISGHDHASGGSYSGWCLSGMLMWLSLSGVRSVLLQQ